jgi:hypothetical protein
VVPGSPTRADSCAEADIILGYVPMHQTVYEGNLPDLKESFNLGFPLPDDDGFLTILAQDDAGWLEVRAPDEISPALVTTMLQFSRDVGILDKDLGYADVVAADGAAFWTTTSRQPLPTGPRSVQAG